MTKRPTGRPKATHPKDTRITIRLTEEEIDRLLRAKPKGESRSDFVRRCLVSYMAQANVFGTQIRDTEEARIQRARRAARRANAAPQPDLEQHIAEASLSAEEELSSSMPQGKGFQHVKHLLP